MCTDSFSVTTPTMDSLQSTKSSSTGSGRPTASSHPSLTIASTPTSTIKLISWVTLGLRDKSGLNLACSGYPDMPADALSNGREALDALHRLPYDLAPIASSVSPHLPSLPLAGSVYMPLVFYLPSAAIWYLPSISRASSVSRRAFSYSCRSPVRTCRL